MTGGDGFDRFVFETVADSTLTASDYIRGWDDQDLIDLSAIDAIAGGADDAFTLVCSFSGAAGELVVRRFSGNSYEVLGDVDGGGADFRILGINTGAFNLGDFLL